MKVEGFWRSHQVPHLQGPRRPPSTCGCSRVDAQLPTRRAVRRGGPATAGTGGTRAAGHRRMGANPHANGGLLRRELQRARRRRAMPSTCRSPGDASAEATRVLGRLSARRHRELNADSEELPHRGSGRDRLEPAGCRVRGHRPGLDGGDRALRRAAGPPTGGSWRS